MAQYLGIRALTRSQQVRIGGQKITTDRTHFVDVSDGKTRRELNHHATCGAVVVVAGLSATNEAVSPVVAKEVTFAENGAGTYTGAVAIPAGATILDIAIHGDVLWAAGTSATLKVGDAADDDGFFTGVNLKATDLLAGESISFDNAGGKAGAYIANSQVSKRYDAAARVVSGIVTSVGAGTSGRTRMTVVYALPLAADVVAATKA